MDLLVDSPTRVRFIGGQFAQNPVDTDVLVVSSFLVRVRPSYLSDSMNVDECSDGTID